MVVRAEGVRFDDVRAGFEIIGMNFLDHLRPRQIEQFEAAFEIFALPIAKPFAAVIRFGQFVALDHRSHRAIEHDDPLAHQSFQRMNPVCRHDVRELNGVSPVIKEQIDAS